MSYRELSNVLRQAALKLALPFYHLKGGPNVDFFVELLDSQGVKNLIDDLEDKDPVKLPRFSLPGGREAPFKGTFRWEDLDSEDREHFKVFLDNLKKKIRLHRREAPLTYDDKTHTYELVKTGAHKGEQEIRRHTGDLLRAAQKEYDEWDDDRREFELGEGGICQDIAEAMAGVLIDKDIEASTVSASVGDQHVWVVAKLADGVYTVDIPPSVYERGGGYRWEKIEDVEFKPGHIEVDLLDDDPEKYEEYIED
jgi:hypothetical protein